MKKINKNFLVGIGLIAIVVAPIATVVSCGSEVSANVSTILSFKTSSTLLPKLVDTKANDMNNFDSTQKVVENIITEENQAEITKAINLIKNKSEKISVNIQFADSQVQTDIQIKWANSKPIITVNKVYISQSNNGDVTNSIGKFRINIFKEFARKFVVGLVSANIDLNSNLSHDEINSRISSQIGTIKNDGTDPLYNFSIDSNNLKVSIVKGLPKINPDEFINDILALVKVTKEHYNFELRNLLITLWNDQVHTGSSQNLNLNDLFIPANLADVKSKFETWVRSGTNSADLMSIFYYK